MPHEIPTHGPHRYKDGKFRCGQVNILLALSDVGPGDGGTMVVPGSHKSNFPHPYGVSWGSTRDGHRYSEELLDRLRPERRSILLPVAPRSAGVLGNLATGHHA